MLPPKLEFTFAHRHHVILIRSQLLLGLILPLLLIAVGLIGIGKRNGLNTM
jgi:hypothetical protein